MNATKGLRKARHYLTVLSRLNEEKFIGSIHVKQIDSSENIADLVTQNIGGAAHIKLSSMALGYDMSFLNGSSYHKRSTQRRPFDTDCHVPCSVPDTITESAVP